ncbi:MAG: class I SAM-dependent methyltransferase [Lautropia sp.]
MTQTPEQVRRHYLIEKELAARLRDAAEDERRQLYAEVYDELYRRVPDHPMLVAKEAQSRIRELTVQRKLRMLKRYLTPRTVFMEIGAGDCLMSRRVAPLVASVIAVEVSSVIAAQARLPANMSIEIIDKPADIPAAPGSVHLAFSDQLVEHLHPDDFVQQSANVLAALAPGGRYVIVTPNGINGPHDVSRGFDPVATGMHLKEYTYTEMRSILLGLGYSRVEPLIGLKGVYLRFPGASVSIVEAVLGRLPTRLARRLANTLALQMVLAIRLVATR